VVSIRESISGLLPFIRRRKGVSSLDPFTGIATVMLWDISGFSGALEGCTSEALARVLSDDVGSCDRSVERASGHVLQSMGDAGLALWLPALVKPSHAQLAFQCGATICSRLARPKNSGLSPHLRIALGTGQLTGRFILGRYQVFGVARATAERLQRLDLQRRTSMLYTSETLALVRDLVPQTEPVAKFTKTTGEEVQVFEYCDDGS